MKDTWEQYKSVCGMARANQDYAALILMVLFFPFVMLMIAWLTRK